MAQIIAQPLTVQVVTTSIQVAISPAIAVTEAQVLSKSLSTSPLTVLIQPA